MTSLLERLRPGTRTQVCAAYAIAFVCVAIPVSLQLRALAPTPEIDMLSPKLRQYAQNADRYDTVFLGTSRTLYHVLPSAVEGAAAEAGCPGMNVYNFGLYGMTGAEQDWTLDQVLALKSPALRRIVIEPPLPEARSLKEALSDRARFFHGPDQHADAIASIWSYPESIPKRIFRVGVYSIGTAYDLTGVGRGSTYVFKAPEKAGGEGMDFRENGFEALDEVTSEDIEKRHQQFLDDPEGFQTALARYNGARSPNLDSRADYLIKKARKIESSGIAPALFVSPDPMELDRTPQTAAAFHAAAPDIPVFNFNRPDVYPELFERDVWQDFSHFSRVGATQLSRKIGQEMCASIIAEDELYVVR